MSPGTDHIKQETTITSTGLLANSRLLPKSTLSLSFKRS